MKKTKKKATPAKKEDKELKKQNESLKIELRDLNSNYQKEITELKRKINELESNQKPIKKKVLSMDVFNKDGKYVRTFDEELHKGHYKEYAEKYAKKIKGSTK